MIQGVKNMFLCHYVKKNIPHSSFLTILYLLYNI